jgi:peptide-methionine (S)-S-oxide reductase
MAGLAVSLALATTAASPSFGEQASAIFAGGCFWCTEADFDKVPGVISTTSGYIGGSGADATYQKVSSGATKHTEAVKVVYDPSKVSYQKLVDYFWTTIDPTVKDRQFCDTGSQYRSGIFVGSSEERKDAEETKKQVAARLKTTIHTEITDAGTFYPAEEYHQDFYTKNSAKYKFYRWNCGRDQRLKQIWGEAKGAS